MASDVVPAYDGLDATAIELLSLAVEPWFPSQMHSCMLAMALSGMLAYAWRERR